MRKGGESVGNWPLVDFNQEIVCDAERGERERGRGDCWLGPRSGIRPFCTKRQIGRER